MCIIILPFELCKEVSGVVQWVFGSEQVRKKGEMSAGRQSGVRKK